MAAPDPLGSPMWDYHAQRIFGTAPVRFDARVGLAMPMIAENQRVFPIAVDARGVDRASRILIFADLNPIPVAIDYRLDGAAAYVTVRIKLDQRTPVRAAVQRAGGDWLVTGNWIDAAGGGCSAPPVSRVRGDWAEHLGEIRGAAWAGERGHARLRLLFRHPMDTGLVENIPAYHLETLTLRGENGQSLGEMALQASVAEDPALTLLPCSAPGSSIRIDARDTNGRTYAAAVKVPTP